MSDHIGATDPGETLPDPSDEAVQSSDDRYSGHHDHRPKEPTHKNRSDDPYSGHHDHRPKEPTHRDPEDDPYSGHHDHDRKH